METQSGRTTGPVFDVDDERITLRGRDGITSFERHEVCRVVLRTRPLDRKARRILGIIGAGIGVVSGFKADEAREPAIALLAAVYWTLGGAIGMVIDVSEVRESVYEAPSKPRDASR